jgi:hypothetical protein
LTDPPYGWLRRRDLEIVARERARLVRGRGGRLRRSDQELLGQLHWPQRHHTLLEAHDPGPEVALFTVANDRFSRGLEALLLSLRAVYPSLSAAVVVAHDGSLGPFLQRRLQAIHPSLTFVRPEPAWASDLPRDSRNRRRIGVLGYLNSHALNLRGYRRVLALDSDLLITGALDPLWAEGEAFRAVPDCGDRPWAAVSPHTGRPVLNSGVLSLPGSALTPALQTRLEGLIRRAAEPVCPLLDRFADQKVWNQLLADQPLELLPLNFNCNVKYLVQFLGGCAEGLSVVHFAGPKPWLTWPWVEPDPGEQRPGAVCDHLFWNRIYRQQLMAWRLQLLAEQTAAAAPPPPGPARLASDPHALLHQCGAEESGHLLLAAAELFGAGWPDQPCWPEGWPAALEALASPQSPLQLWAPLEWEPALRGLSIPAGAQWRWLLIEAPFSPPLAEGDDLIAEAGPWQEGFEPWSDPLVPALVRAVRRRLAAAGVGPVHGP